MLPTISSSSTNEFKQPKKKKKTYQSNDAILLPLPIPIKCPEDNNVNLIVFFSFSG